jgi:recombination protein RecT
MSNNQQVQKAGGTTLTGLSQLMDKYKEQIAMALPKHVTPERMIRVALTAVSQSPKLLECNPYTICGAVVQASILGIEPSSVLGECFLVPFWNKKANSGRGGMECQLIVGYRGKIKLIENTGNLLGLNAKAVHVNDEFEFNDGLDPFVTHRYHHIEDRGPVYGYWAGAALKSGFKKIEFARIKELEEHRDRFAMTRGKDDKIFGVWITNFDAMALKTMVHRVCNLLPKSPQAQAAWSLDDRAEAGVPQRFSVEVPLELHQSGSFDEPGESDAEQTPQITEPKRTSDSAKQQTELLPS